MAKNYENLTEIVSVAGRLIVPVGLMGHARGVEPRDNTSDAKTK
jgi:hypothetical protein